MIHPFDFCFFFQAEDGIRDIGVTGVQTCALPICKRSEGYGRDGVGSCQAERREEVPRHLPSAVLLSSPSGQGSSFPCSTDFSRSEERRVGKECRSLWSP